MSVSTDGGIGSVNPTSFRMAATKDDPAPTAAPSRESDVEQLHPPEPQDHVHVHARGGGGGAENDARENTVMQGCPFQAFVHSNVANDSPNNMQSIPPGNGKQGLACSGLGGSDGDGDGDGDGHLSLPLPGALPLLADLHDLEAPTRPTVRDTASAITEPTASAIAPTSGLTTAATIATSIRIPKSPRITSGSHHGSSMAAPVLPKILRNTKSPAHSRQSSRGSSSPLIVLRKSPTSSSQGSSPTTQAQASNTGSTKAPFSVSSSPVRSSSNTNSNDELPNDVSTVDQLQLLPPECLSGDPIRPLRHVDEMGRQSFYALQPTFYSVCFILMVELLERFSFYGLNYTQTSYLTGAYNEDWNAGMQAVTASSYVSISVAMAYSAPFIGAILSDRYLGEYWTILTGSFFFYLPGLFLIAFTTIPGFLGEDFNRWALSFGFLVLWPCGTGTIKSVVNVFGAKQYHPLLQSSLIEPYYVNFYMCINVGALIGGFVIPLMAQKNVTVAYFLPVVALATGIMLFLCGTPRYVNSRPIATASKSFGSASSRLRGPALRDSRSPSSSSSDTIPLDVIFRISMLVVPFNIAYSQMATTFIVQGTVMEKAFGFIDAATMNNADSISVLLFGYLISSQFLPWLAKRDFKLSSTHKFALGSALGVAAIGWSLLVEHMIHAEYQATGGKITIMWQALSYILIGMGEIFAISTAYEVAFTASPPEKKVLASAVNLYCVGGIPNVVCILLYNLCQPWFRNSNGTTHLTRLEDYATAHVANYFWILFVVAMVGVVINLLPTVRKWVESIEEKASDLIRTPKTPTRPPTFERMMAQRGEQQQQDVESAPLLRIKRHEAYLLYGSGPILIKSGSMRAGASMYRPNLKPIPKHVKRHQIAKFYRNDHSTSSSPSTAIILNSSGKPLLASAILNTSNTNSSCNTNAVLLLDSNSDNTSINQEIVAAATTTTTARSNKIINNNNNNMEALLPPSRDFPPLVRSSSN